MNSTTLSREDLQSYRQQLQSLADRLSRNVAQLTAEATRPTGTESAEAERADQERMAASNAGDEEIARGTLTLEGELLTEVNAALARLDAGMFGRCETCGQSIGKRRLNAVPYARHCINCSLAAERIASG